MELRTFTFMTLTLMWVFAIPQSFAGSELVAASTCRGLNPGSESGLSWNYGGVQNNSNRDRWVVCSLGGELLSETQDNELAVVVANGSNLVREITCIFRYISAAAEDLVTVTRRIAVSSNDIASETVNERNTLIYGPTVTCKLPRNTGIAFLGAEITY